MSEQGCIQDVGLPVGLPARLIPLAGIQYDGLHYEACSMQYAVCRMHLCIAVCSIIAV